MKTSWAQACASVNRHQDNFPVAHGTGVLVTGDLVGVPVGTTAQPKNVCFLRTACLRDWAQVGQAQ